MPGADMICKCPVALQLSELRSPVRSGLTFPRSHQQSKVCIKPRETGRARSSAELIQCG